jgi:hypothetical protein
MTVAFAVIAHDNPRLVARVARLLLDSGGIVAIHYDAQAPAADFAELQDLLSGFDQRVLWAERVAVSWGQWSMVRATLNLLDAIAAAEAPVDYVHLMSGADYPIAPTTSYLSFLQRAEGQEFIQCHDPARWIVDGLSHQRWQYRHYFNFKKHPALFHYSWHAQRLLRLRRRFPRGYHPQLGAQWWTLTWETCARVLELSRDTRLTRFFEKTWIPDEMYIQTLVASFVPRARIAGHALTLHQFTDYGVPVVFTNGHEDYLARQPFFFARKISPHGDDLRDHLDAIVAGTAPRRDCPDQEIGQPTPEYERRRSAGAKGHLGKRTMGQVRDVRFGELEWNLQPYFVAIGFSRHELLVAQSRLQGLPGLLCHGELFAPEGIEFAGCAARFAGLSREDTALRDHKRSNAFAQILQETPDRLTGFLLRSDQGREIADLCVRDPNARVVFVLGDPVAGFLSHHLGAEAGDGEAPENGATPELFAAEYRRFVTFHQRAVGYFENRRATGTFDWPLSGENGSDAQDCPAALRAYLGLSVDAEAAPAEPAGEAQAAASPYQNLPLATELYAVKAAIDRAAGYALKVPVKPAKPGKKPPAPEKLEALWF